MISFYGYASKVTHGGDGSRLELTVKDAPADLGQAIQLMPLKNKVLAVRVLLGSGDEQVCEFQASIAPIMTGLEFRPHVAKVKLDVPETDALASARLLGHQESALRFQITTEGEKPAKEKESRKPSKGDHGQFWYQLYTKGFMTHPDMLEIYYTMRKANHRNPDYPAEQILRDCFGVTSRAQISPTELKDWLRVRRLPEASGVWMLIEQAERNTGQ